VKKAWSFGRETKSCEQRAFVSRANLVKCETEQRTSNPHIREFGVARRFCGRKINSKQVGVWAGESVAGSAKPGVRERVSFIGEGGGGRNLKDTGFGQLTNLQSRK